jgi:hypothetical protein
MASPNPAMFSWQQPLAALFGGLSAAGQPGGFANFGMGVNQALQQQQGAAQAQQMAELRDMQIQQQQQEMARANKEAADREATGRQLASMVTGQMPVKSVGNYGAATGGVQTGQPAMFKNWSPEQRAVFAQFAQSNPAAAQQFVVEQQFAQPDTQDAPTVKDFYEGGNVVQKQWDGQQWVKVGEGARWEPNAPAAGGEFWEPYVDPVTKRAGQKNTKTGKIDWDPGNTMMVQTGTDANGNPVYDLVSGSPGPSKEYEAKMANQVTLMEDGIDGLEKLVKEDSVSPARAALGEGVSQLGPLGDVLSETLILGPKEKQYMAKRASALESLANTITGAAFTEQQKQNFIAMLPKPTDDDETFKSKLASMRNYMSQLKKNAKVSETPAAGNVVDGYTITPVD